MKARCPCTMVETEQGVYSDLKGVKFRPDPNCPHCQGEGELEVSIPIHKIIAIWNGVCQKCGSCNGTHIQYEDSPVFDPSSYPFKPICINPNCEEEHCEWIKDDDLDL